MNDRIILFLCLTPLATVTILWFRTAKRARWLLCGAVMGFLLFWGPFASGLLRWLEAPYGRGLPPPDGVQAIVVLSGAVFPPEPERPVPLVGEDTYERAFYAAWLYNHWRHAPVLICGGAGRDDKTETPFSHTIKILLITEGVPADAISTEDQSVTTYENTLYAAEILRRRGISRVALVTQGYHMRRSEAALRKQGIDVVPAPCGFLGRSRIRPDQIFLPSQEAFDWSMTAIHEVVGLLWYHARGYI